MRARTSTLAGTALALVLVLTLAACGDSEDSGDGGSGTTATVTTATTPATTGTTADLGEVCAQTAKMERSLADLQAVDVGAPTGPGDLAGAMDEIRKGVTAITAALPELDTGARGTVEAANTAFTSTFIDIGFKLSDALTAGEAATIKAQASKLASSFDDAYAPLDCP